MADQLQLRGGTTSQTNSFTGANKEVTVDTNKKTLVIHDGATVGGFSLAGVAQPDGSIHFDDRNGVERMRLTSDGNLAIGRNNASQKIDVEGNINIRGDLSCSTGIRRIGFTVDQNLFNGTDAIYGLTRNGVSGSNTVALAGQNGLMFRTGGIAGQTEKMRLTSDGRLGIGTTSVTSTLTVKGDVQVNGRLKGNAAQDFGVNTGTGTTAVSRFDGVIPDINYKGVSVGDPFTVFNFAKGPSTGGVDQPSGVAIKLSCSSDLSANESSKSTLLYSASDSAFSNSPFFGLSTLNTERLRVSSSGYFKADRLGSYIAGGFGSYHEFNNEQSEAVLRLNNTSSNNSGAVIGLRTELSNTLTNQRHIASLTNGSIVFSVASNGDVIGGAGSTFSDIKLKENIADATSKLEDINKVRFVNYQFKEGPRAGNKEFGVIAQELEEIFPNLIINTPDTEEVEVTKTETFETSEQVLDENGEQVLDENGEPVTETKTEEREVTTTETRETGEVTKSVKYSVLTLMAVKALQEADAKIVAQQSIIDDLLARVEALENA